MINLNDYQTDVEREEGRYLFTHYGAGALLGFEGSEDFQRHSYNLAYNYGMIYQRLSLYGPLVQLHRLTARLSYVYTSAPRIRKGLSLYFRNQMLMNRNEIVELAGLPVVDEPFDYSHELLQLVEHEADRRAQAFYEKRIDKTDFMHNYGPANVIDFYRLVLKGI